MMIWIHEVVRDPDQNITDPEPDPNTDPDQNITDLQHNDDLDPVVVVQICGSGPKYHRSGAGS